MQLPVINISEATPTVGKAMIDAATKNGFFYVDSSSSDFSNADVENAFAMVCLIVPTPSCQIYPSCSSKPDQSTFRLILARTDD